MPDAKKILPSDRISELVSDPTVVVLLEAIDIKKIAQLASADPNKLWKTPPPNTSQQELVAIAIAKAREVMESSHGGPAFPVDQAGAKRCPGISKRDYFAAAALPGLIEGYDYEAREKSRATGRVSDRTGFDDRPHDDSDATYASQLAGEAYIIADAMLRARDASTNPDVTR